VSGPRRLPWLLTGGVVIVGFTVTLAVLFGGLLVDGSEEPSAALLAATQAPPVSLAPDAAPGAITSTEPVVPAPALRLLLEQLLGEHVLVLAGASADVADGATRQAGLDAVQSNTDALGGAIGLVYGDVGEQAFTSLWTQHVAFFIDRGAALGSGDRDLVAEADAHLHHYERDFGSFTQTATGGELPADVVTFLLEGHVADINAFVAAHLDGDGDVAARELATGLERVADIGAGFATAISVQGPSAFPGETSGPAVDPASAVGRALATYLAATSLDLDAPDAHADLRQDLVQALAAVSDNAEVTRAAVGAWLDADRDGVQAAAEDLSLALDVDDPDALTDSLADPVADILADALVTYHAGLDAGLLDPATKEAHDAAYQIAGALLGR
jgi:hypothetical protein